jgi:hypothetical protein
MNMETKEPLCRVRDIYRLINDFELEFHTKYERCSMFAQSLSFVKRE